MHTNYYFLRQLTSAIHNDWVGTVIHETYTQDRNELILHAHTRDQEDLYLKAHLSPSFCCLSFPREHHRARKNSMNLFRETEEIKITGIHQFDNERAFTFLLENEMQLLFKMYGNRSNILLYRENEVLELFRSELKNDLQLSPHLDRPLDQSQQNFISNGGNYKVLFPTFGKEVASWLETRGYSEKSLDEKWTLIEGILLHLDQPEYYVEEDDEFIFSLLPMKKARKFSQPVEGLNYFFQQYFMQGVLLRERKAVLQPMLKEISRTEKYLERMGRKLQEITTRTSWRHKADVVMANLNRIPRGSNEVTLENFYDEGKPLTISLNPSLSPQDNAASFYQKSKNQHREIRQLEQNIAEREQQLLLDMEHVEALEKLEDIKELRRYIQDQGLAKQAQAQGEPSFPYREYEVSGFIIRVGRNSKANDLMLQRFSYKEDLWLHAKDVAGSHVLIKHQAGKTIPEPVIEQAAQLAGFYSKRKNDTLCPVIVTPRKYVRKRKGDPPGMVVVDREERVILVPPGDL